MTTNQTTKATRWPQPLLEVAPLPHTEGKRYNLQKMPHILHVITTRSLTYSSFFISRWVHFTPPSFRGGYSVYMPSLTHNCFHFGSTLSLSCGSSECLFLWSTADRFPKVPQWDNLGPVTHQADCQQTPWDSFKADTERLSGSIHSHCAGQSWPSVIMQLQRHHWIFLLLIDDISLQLPLYQRNENVTVDLKRYFTALGLVQLCSMEAKCETSSSCKL